MNKVKIGNDLKWREDLAISQMHCHLASNELNEKLKKQHHGLDWTARVAAIGRAIECLERALIHAKQGHVSLMESRGASSPYADAPPPSPLQQSTALCPECGMGNPVHRLNCTLRPSPSPAKTEGN